MKNKILILTILIIIYILLKYLIQYWNYLVYPVNLFVTFLHEFWHSFWALMTWWSVKSIEINSNWSWFAVTSGWIRGFVLMWGYIWSAIFGNILLYIGIKNKKYSEYVIYLISFLMIFTSIFWFNSLFSSVILIVFWVFLFFLSKKIKYDEIILQFLWISSLIYIIEDFSVWPSSDIAKFSEIFIIIPSSIWMIIWLLIVIFVTIFNLKLIFKK
jgi:hypothetical protein